MIDDMYEVGFGQATSDGDYDDVDTPYTVAGNVSTANGLAWLIIVGSIVGLWVTGAFIFKGANHS